MKKTLTGILAGLAIALTLTACSSTPTKEQDAAPVVDGRAATQQPAVKAPIAVTSQPIKSAQIDPGTALAGRAALKDPNNILSKRIIYFEYDSNLVKEEYRPLVAAHAKYLAEDRTAKMIIQGNTDERGGSEYNLALGQRRAEAVKQMMTVLGAEGSRVESVSFGKEKPRVDGSNEAAYAQNRRAEIVYQGE